MATYYFIIEAEPQRENPVIAHASRGVAHIWLIASDIDEAKAKALQYLSTERWDVIEEKEAVEITQEQIDEMNEEKLSNYQTAQTDGISSKFYYWHRSE